MRKRAVRKYPPHLWEKHETVLLYLLRDHYIKDGNVDWRSVARAMQDMGFSKRTDESYRARINSIDRGSLNGYVGFEYSEETLDQEWKDKYHQAISKKRSYKSKPRKNLNSSKPDVEQISFNKEQFVGFVEYMREVGLIGVKLDESHNEIHFIYQLDATL